MRKTFTAISIACVLAVSGIAIARYTHEGTTTNARTAAKSELQSGSGMPSSAPLTLGNIRIDTKADKSAAPQTTMSSGVSTTSGIQAYTSSQTQGVIGIPEGRVSDNPEDNIFEISLPQVAENNSRAWLSYDVRGIAPDGVSWSVNDRPSVGGYLLSRTDSWTAVREEISPEWLQSGRNTVLFSIPSEAGCTYTVRNVRIETATSDTKKNGTAAIVLSSLPTVRSGKAYIHGFFKGKVSNISVDGEPLVLNGNEFEGMVPVRDGRLHLTADLPSGKLEKSVNIQEGKPADYTRAFVAAGNGDGKRFFAYRADSLSVGGGFLSVAKGDIAKSAKFSIAPLRETDIPALDYGMTNVTAKGEGYRFLPHGNHFEGKGATVRIKYDRTKIPSGFTEDDINTYYFDRDTRHWVALERVKVDKATASVVSRTTHFTDMINGVIKAPESPQTDGFTPTMMNDIKAADPTAKINLITPPTANNRGSANLRYPFEMPPARNGMAPSLGIQYSSEGGSGWLGEGWNLSVPNITLDTRWGVPRYDQSKETETYLLSGSMLSTMDDNGQMGVAHRGEKMSRKADRQFYTRQGGDFSRIIRKGDSPANYYWEVTDKQGIKYTYGGEGAVLKGTATDASGASHEVISEWKLKRVEETHGDYIEYVYETADEPVRGGLVGKAIYLKEVRAGNSGQVPHTVVVFEGSKEKRLKTNNARYGFLTSSNRLLEKMTVNFQGNVLRSYAFTYGEGAFYKDVLTGVRHLDDKGGEVSFQNFGYYDDVQSDKGYVPFKDSQETWNTHNDGLDAGFVNPLQAISKRFSDKPTALGGTTGTSYSGSFYAGVGVDDKSPWKGNTVGASYSYSTDNSKGLSALVDINGDGLPDKVYRDGSTLYYRPQLSNSSGKVTTYGEPIKINGIRNFSTAKSTTNSGGAKAIPGYGKFTAVVGVDVSKTKTKTTEYFSDINGDGLVDLVSNGKVYFNHIEFDGQGNAVPTFTLSSADTPSPIIYSGKVDASVIKIDPAEQQELIASSPMEDMVRVWQAPKAGTVSISGNVSLIVPSGDYDTEEYTKADGVRVAIQKGSTELWNKNIAKGDAASYNAAVQNVAVKKGDRIYFRVQSGTEETSNGAFDQVKWAPVITYTGTGETLPDGMSTTAYKSEEGAVYDVNTVTSTEGSTAITLRGKFTKPVTSDDITLKVIASNEEKDSLGNDNPAYKTQEIYTRTFAYNETFDGELTETIANAGALPNLQFQITSTSNVDWTRVKWAPQAELTTADGKQTVSAAPHYVLYQNMVSEGKPFTLTVDAASLTVTPAVTFVPTSGKNGTVTMTVKSENRLWGKKTYTVTNGIMPNDALTLNNVSAGKVWVDYFYSGEISPGDVITSSAAVTGTGSVQTGFYAQAEDDGFGPLYRGWGGFVYNAAEGRYAKPIDESLLVLPKDKDAKLDPRTMVFTPIGTDQSTLSRWMGQNQDIYLTGDEMSSARLAEQDVILTNPLETNVNIAALSGDCLQGTGAAAVTQVSENKSTDTQSGAMGITYNDANGHMNTLVSMMDMNGDSYPDIVAGGSIQYTNSLGGISGEKYESIGNVRSDNESYAWGYGGNPIVSVSNIIGGKAGAKLMDLARNTWLGKISITGSAPKNNDTAVESFTDINGDGLPDKIEAGNKVRINLGYSFTEPIDWQIDRIQGGQSLSYNGGVGVDLASSSFSAGMGIVTTETSAGYDLMDINSDGLPDKVWKTDNGIMVALNNGQAFDTPILWKGLTGLTESASTSESVNGAYTHYIPITVFGVGVKITLNPGASTGHSINRTTYSLQDVDGDGYLDIVESEKESELKVTRSAIGRTNMLKTVTNSLGGTFTLDYKHSTPTYGLPGGKWVMSSVTVDDGIHDDGPLMKTLFDYSDGQKDRHEREFLGFGKVITKNIDTEKGDSAVYRQAVQLYDVSTYYAQGNELGASVEDAEGNKYTETHNEYDGYYLTANGDKYTFTKQSVLCSDRASAFVPLRYTANRQYEGQASGITTSEAWNEYYLTGYHGELKSYKFSDKGKLGADGSGRFDYQTAIQYTSNAGKHIYGLPTDVTVTDGDGKAYHHVTATYDVNYADHITQIRQQLGSGEAVSDYTYDAYGNITRTTLPANAKGQRMWYSYRYEPVMNMYVERVDDAFGYRSEADNFDYRYGMALQRRDLNNFYYETDIDNLGRVKAVRGPNELATGVPYIIAFDYQPKATFGENGIMAPAYAVTKHYDIQHPNDDMETVTFVDGFGRPVQVKKDGVVTTAAKGSAPKDETVMIVSGRNVYDAFGRVAKAYYPTTEAIGSKATFNKAFDNVSPIVTVYDVLDRVMKVTLPDGSETKTAYTTDTGTNTLKTTVTDALGHQQSTYTDGSGKTLKTEQLSGPDGTITTSFEYDGIDRLVKVTDTDGNVTTSVYDMGDRRTEVNHPASGITTFTYDNLGNVLSKQTANLRKEGKAISYEYDYGRLTAINYPDHPENNVKYYYGGRNASQNRIGRLMLREDGSGAVEYFYGKMGEVVKTRRTMIVPNQAIATYVTQWTYDSHNRLLEMIYPDEEKITYSYNLGGQVDHVRGYKSYGYDYVNKIGYDKFEQRTYLKYCNGAETFYSYDPQRRRLQNLVVNAKAGTIMDNAYTYDAVSNVLSVKNGASLPQSGKAGGQMSHQYTYDALYRLASATGTYTGADNKTASYTLAMGYDNMHRITSKKQHLTQQNVQFNGSLSAGYDLTYTYQDSTGHKFQLANVQDVNYRTEGTAGENDKVNNGHRYTYDDNGNLVYINTSRVKKDGKEDEKATEQKFKWDEENRLLAADENGFVSNYWYDADGERTVKTSGEGEQIYVNSEFAGGRTNTAKFSLYVSPYLVANQGGRYTKHIYIGSQRIVSKLGDFASYGSDPRRIPYAGSEADAVSVDYKGKYASQQQVIKDNYATFNVPYNGEDNNDYVDGEGFCCNDGTPEAAQAQAMAANTAKAKATNGNFKGNDDYEKMQFYYHPDHLGSSSYITNLDGEVVQHIEYVPFGEVFVEERNNIWNTPYLFNAKEFDEETGMYYYGARYYEPRLSLWMSVDNEQENHPNVSTYTYCLNNPILFIDPDGNGVWTKLGKVLVKVSAKVGKQGVKALSQTATFTSAFSDVLNDVNTLTDKNSSGWDKVKAGVSLASELLPVSVHDIKDAYKLAKKGKKAISSAGKVAKKIRPNFGLSPRHGGKVHNDKIDKLIERLKRDPNVTNIRKNQRQVDIHGNIVGRNRPDVQFDKNGIHTNVEYDTHNRSMQQHKKVLPQNDPNSRNKFYKVNNGR